MVNQTLGRWVLLRGLTRECRHWGGFTELLAQTLPHSDIQCIDLPGNGLLHEQASPAQVSRITDAVRAQHESRGGVYVLGLSMGGMVAIDWALRYPEEVAGLVLINSSLAELNPIWQRVRWQVWLSMVRAFLTSAENREELIYKLTCNVRDDQESILSQWLRYQGECPVLRRNFIHQLLAAARYHLPATGNPLVHNALVLAGAGDRLVSPACSSRIATVFDTPLHLHPTAGHDLTHDDPIWVLEQIGEWQESMMMSPECPCEGLSSHH
ncbi:alpha/beta fold hydrolase [Pontibacterium sp.]|uniref:alpha/beta fold hydrolase n=1 Tax=Pontibacterium sp. TaxID=2036026 RepID=UPI003567A404